MNTYTITYWPGGSASPAATTTVHAADFMVNGDFVMFTDQTEHVVFAVPAALTPVITQTASA